MGFGVGPGVGDGVGDGTGAGVDPGDEDGTVPCAATVVGVEPPPQAVRVKVTRIKTIWIKAMRKSEGDRFKKTSRKCLKLCRWD